MMGCGEPLTNRVRFEEFMSKAADWLNKRLI
jgi:hypothetical protein